MRMKDLQRDYVAVKLVVICAQNRAYGSGTDDFNDLVAASNLYSWLEA